MCLRVLGVECKYGILGRVRTVFLVPEYHMFQRLSGIGHVGLLDQTAQSIENMARLTKILIGLLINELVRVNLLLLGADMFQISMIRK